MRRLTGQAERAVADLARRYGVSTGAVRTMLDALVRGNGTLAQFSHPELGGSGQWMAGGMTMIGDLFNQGLQATVSGLAAELSNLLASTRMFEPEQPERAGHAGHAQRSEPSAATGRTSAAGTASAAGSGWSGAFSRSNVNDWWPGDLGRPAASGSQNDSRYAVFPAVRRLAVRSGDGPVRVHDTLDHVITGVQQQQSGAPGTLTFSSQHGTFAVDSLPLVSNPGTAAASSTPPAAANAETAATAETSRTDRTDRTAGATGATGAEGTTEVRASAPAAGGSDPIVILETIDRLSDLHQRGVLSDEEFSAKKAELLARL